MLKEVHSSREHKLDHKEFVTIIRSTLVDALIVDRGGVDTPSEWCEIPNSSHAESKMKERKIENKIRGEERRGEV